MKFSFKAIMSVKNEHKGQNVRVKRTVAMVCFFVFFCTMLPKTYSETSMIDYTPSPYTKDEFPLWVRELRRFEILTLGALPLVTMLSFWTYDIARSIKHAGDERYYPWPLKQSEISVPISSDTQLKIFFTALGISVGIALTDICVRAIIRSIQEQKQAKDNILYDDYIQLEPLPEVDQ